VLTVLVSGWVGYQLAYHKNQILSMHLVEVLMTLFFAVAVVAGVVVWWNLDHKSRVTRFIEVLAVIAVTVLIMLFHNVIFSAVNLMSIVWIVGGVVVAVICFVGTLYIKARKAVAVPTRAKTDTITTSRR
jgi:heme A synthase